MLDRAGTDTEIWTAHSTRGASTSKVAHMGISVQFILEIACWKKVGTFRRFYRKPVIENSEKSVFAKNVLK